MAEKGKQWSDHETKLLLELWSEDSIQRQLQDAARNDAIFRRIAQDLAKSGFERTVAQIRAKIKALKKKYKAIADRMRRSGAGHESDEEENMPVDFPYFDLLHAVMGGRAAVTPVHLLDSATAREVSESPATSGPSASIRTPLVLQLAHIKRRALIKRRTPLGFQLAIIKRTPLALLPAVGLLPRDLLPAVGLLPRDLQPAVDPHLPTMWKMTFQCPKRKERE